MNPPSQKIDRRSFIATACLAASVFALDDCDLINNFSIAGAEDNVNQKPEGKLGEFNFLAGEWKINNRRRKEAGKDEWDTFEGEASCYTILNGGGSVEDLRIPARGFFGMGLRLLDIQKKVWNDYWVSGKNGELSVPGQTGTFENGVGTFQADDMDGDRKIKVKGVWDKITPTSCRWYQAVSWDDGKTWEENWSMDWTRTYLA